MEKKATFESTLVVQAAANAISARIDFLEDTLLEDLHWTPQQVRDMANQHDNYIRSRISDNIKLTKARLNEINQLKSARQSLIAVL